MNYKENKQRMRNPPNQKTKTEMGWKSLVGVCETQRERERGIRSKNNKQWVFYFASHSMTHEFTGLRLRRIQ